MYVQTYQHLFWHLKHCIVGKRYVRYVSTKILFIAPIPTVRASIYEYLCAYWYLHITDVCMYSV